MGQFYRLKKYIAGEGEIPPTVNLHISCFGYTSQGSSVVSLSDSRPGSCDFDTGLRHFFLRIFCLSPLKHVKKVVGGFGKNVVLVLV